MKKTLPNIYHIVLDGFHSLVFQKALEFLNVSHDFKGFTFFPENRANYNDTFASMASILNGGYFNGGPVKKWIQKKINEGLLMQMYQHGYKVNYYNINKKFSFKKAAMEKFQVDFLDHYTPRSSHLSKALKAYNFFTDECLPERIRKGTKLASSILITPFNFLLSSNAGYPSFSVKRFISSECALALPMMLDFIYNEKQLPDKGQYRHIHAMLPHAPYNWTRSFTSANTDYMEQVYCTINLMRLFINELKRLKKFNDSLIIFHGDHGWSNLDMPYPYLKSIPKKILNKIQTNTNYDPTRFLHRTHTLLLINPPGTEPLKPLEISDQVSQLTDIPPTLSHLTGLNIIAKDGDSVFSNTRQTNKEAHLFAGLHKYNKLGLKNDFGVHYLKGTLAHVSINQTHEWKLYPDIPISWH